MDGPRNLKKNNRNALLHKIETLSLKNSQEEIADTALMVTLSLTQSFTLTQVEYGQLMSMLAVTLQLHTLTSIQMSVQQSATVSK